MVCRQRVKQVWRSIWLFLGLLINNCERRFGLSDITVQFEHSRSSSQSTKPRLLHAGEAERQDQIAFLLYDALWRRGASLDRGLSYCQKRRPCLYYRPAENGKLEEVGEFISKGVEGDQVEPWGESSYTRWSYLSLEVDQRGRNVELSDSCLSSPRWRIHRTWQIPEIKFSTCSPFRATRHRFVNLSIDFILRCNNSFIGKTIYLTYCLLRRLIAGLPTIFAKNRDIRYLFLDSGVYWIPSDPFKVS